MEIVGTSTVKTDEISVSSNKYLTDIEVWNERDLPCYKRKVRDKLSAGYLSIFAGAIICYACYMVLMTIGFAFIGDIDVKLSQSLPLTFAMLGIFAIATFILVFAFSKKRMIEFVDSCHGEIGHDGNPFIRKLRANLIFSIILAVAVICYAVYLVLVAKTVSVESAFATFYLLPAIISPMGYFLGMISARNSLSICPVCGRFNTVFRVKSSKDFGEKMDGSHKEHESRSERVGTKTTTTYYTDGSTKVTTAPIYGSVSYVKEYDDYSNLAKYTYLCHECSYTEETLEQKKWKVLKSKYRG